MGLQAVLACHDFSARSAKSVCHDVSARSVCRGVSAGSVCHDINAGSVCHDVSAGSVCQEGSKLDLLLPLHRRCTESPVCTMSVAVSSSFQLLP